LTTSTCEKDLGVTFDDKLLFDVHINNSIKKANGLVGVVYRSFYYLDKNSFLTIYKSMIRPKLE